MDTELRSHYLKALGVADFLHTKTKVKTSDKDKISIKCLVIETNNSHSFCQPGKSQDFLLKMLSTIRLKQKNIKCVSIHANELNSTLRRYDAKAVLLMSKDLSPLSARHFSIHHPSEILANQALKREAWEVLKKIKKWLG